MPKIGFKAEYLGITMVRESLRKFIGVNGGAECAASSVAHQVKGHGVLWTDRREKMPGWRHNIRKSTNFQEDKRAATLAIFEMV